MKRNEFITTAIRYLLAGLLTIIAFRTGSKVLSAPECKSCPGNGICGGETDCQTYLPGKNGNK